ncbi:MAG: DUF934 domain-containing protein [Pseudomonadales bacterium]
MPEQRIIKDGTVVTSNWQQIEKDVTDIPQGEQLMLPYALWKTHYESVKDRKDIAIWFDSEDFTETEWTEQLQKLPLIAIHFPIFTDGRGFTTARMLRQRFNYTGDIRVFGHVLREQMCYLKRCGVSSFVLAEHINLEEAVESLNDFTEYYQCSVDQPQPLFRRM